jgi:hypothetical protein
MSFSATYHISPYPHAITPPVVDRAFCRRALAGVHDATAWRLHTDALYAALEFDGNLTSLLGDGPVDGLEVVKNARELVKGFGAPLSPELRFGLHRQTQGQATGIHNDQPMPGDATHRVMLYFNAPGDDYEGGELRLYHSPAPEDLAATYCPAAGSMIAFEASKKSHHSVENIRRGERVVLVIYFYHIGNCPQRIELLRATVDEAVQSLPERETINAEIVRHLQNGRGDWGEREKRLCSYIEASTALLVHSGFAPSDALERLAGGLSRRRSSPDRRQPDSGPAGSAIPRPAPGVDRLAMSNLDSNLWWASRLSSRLHSAFTAESWAQDLAMLQAAPPTGRPLADLASALYADA